jgi:hypothetical protein
MASEGDAHRERQAAVELAHRQAAGEVISPAHAEVARRGHAG